MWVTDRVQRGEEAPTQGGRMRIVACRAAAGAGTAVWRRSLAARLAPRTTSRVPRTPGSVPRSRTRSATAVSTPAMTSRRCSSIRTRPARAIRTSTRSSCRRTRRSSRFRAGSAATWNFQLHPAFWLGMAMCDTQSAPEYQHTRCTPDSDAKSSTTRTRLRPTTSATIRAPRSWRCSSTRPVGCPGRPE